jgi:HSP20 family protein
MLFQPPSGERRPWQAVEKDGRRPASGGSSRTYWDRRRFRRAPVSTQYAFDAPAAVVSSCDYVQCSRLRLRHNDCYMLGVKATHSPPQQAKVAGDAQSEKRALRREDIMASDERIRIAPDHTAYTDDDHTVFTVEIDLVGVPKDRIKLRMREDSFCLSAPADDKVYVMSHGTCHPVDPEKATATYADGLLKIQVPFKEPLKPAVDVAIDWEARATHGTSRSEGRS